MRPAAVSVLCAAMLAAGCTAPLAQLDSARVRPPGDLALVVGLEAAALPGAARPYDLVEPDETGRAESFPFTRIHVLALARLRVGLAPHLELQGQLHLSGLSGGLATALKAQLLGADSDRHDDTALALVLRGGYHFAPEMTLFDPTADVFHQLFAEATLALTLPVGTALELSLLPRARYDWLIESDCDERDHGSIEECAGDALWTGGSVGVGLHVDGGQILLELGLLYALPLEATDPRDAWLPVIAIGLESDLPGR